MSPQMARRWPTTRQSTCAPLSNKQPLCQFKNKLQNKNFQCFSNYIILAQKSLNRKV